MGRHGLAVFLALFLSITTRAHISSFGSSGIAAPKYADILKLTEKWRAEYPGLIDIVDYGKSVDGRTLRLVVMAKKSGRFSRRPALLMSGATHGNEYLNIEDRLPEELLKQTTAANPVSRFIDSGGVYVFVPVLNPDGFDKKVRENSNGIDLNRDWDVKAAEFQGFKEIETKALSTAINMLQEKMNLKFQVTVDYHCCIGALLHPWSFENAPKLTENELDKHRAVGELATKYLKIDYGTTGDILGYYPMGTTKDFYFDRYHAASFTFEGRYMKENTHLPDHVKWWEEMTSLVMGEPELLAVSLKSKKKKLFFLAD